MQTTPRRGRHYEDQEMGAPASFGLGFATMMYPSIVIRRFSVPAVLAAALLVPGCKKTEKAPDTVGSAAPTPPPAAPPPPSTSVVPVATLDAIALPAPKGATATWKWLPQESTKDGNRLAYFGEGTNSWIQVQVLDCNLPRMKEDAAKPAGKRNGDAAYCLDTMDGKLGAYPLYNKYGSVRAVRVGHLAVIAAVGGAGSATLKDADLEAYLGSLDLAALAKL